MRIQLLHDFYWHMNSKFWKTLAKTNPTLATKLWYKKCTGRLLDIKNPKALSEKLQYLKLNDYFHNTTVRQCTDKFQVRTFVKECGCEDILNTQYAVFESVDEIDWASFPNTFAIKCNHGCGGNILCYDKDKLNIELAKKKLKKWMKNDYGLEHVEYSYDGIPRRIICEKFIKSEDGYPPRDYKIFCTYGKPVLIYTISGRKDNSEYLDYFTTDWKWIDVRNGSLPNAPIHPAKPEKLNELLSFASKLSKDFPIVRVDLYCEFGQILFGELTFLPTGGVFVLDPIEYDMEFGALFPDVTRKS